MAVMVVAEESLSSKMKGGDSAHSQYITPPDTRLKTIHASRIAQSTTTDSSVMLIVLMPENSTLTHLVNVGWANSAPTGYMHSDRQSDLIGWGLGQTAVD